MKRRGVFRSISALLVSVLIISAQPVHVFADKEAGKCEEAFGECKSNALAEVKGGFMYRFLPVVIVGSIHYASCLAGYDFCKKYVEQ